MRLEICVDHPRGIKDAVEGGADRLELCAALVLGGLTPSAALVRRAVAAGAGGVAMHAMVRPRGGDFAYDDAEVTAATEEAFALIDQSVGGLVFGAARDGRLDEAALARWTGAVRRRAPAIALTLHRAVDTTHDPVGSVAIAAALGFDRILTSGGAADAWAGATTIARMVAAARGTGVTIVAGAGVRPDIVERLVTATGVAEVHASASVPLPSADPGAVALGFDTPPRRRTDRATVRGLRDALDRLETSKG